MPKRMYDLYRVIKISRYKDIGHQRSMYNPRTGFITLNFDHPVKTSCD